MKTARISRSQGFTLVELIIVIAIIAILAVIVYVVINPLEITRRTRDTTRLSDLANIHQAISVAVQEATLSGNTVLCVPPATAPCTESSYPVGANTRKSDGTGWVKVNLSSQKSVSLPTLPVDPLNNATNKYTYYSDGSNWELNAKLESDQQKDVAKTDGGNDDTVYEKGSDLKLIVP